MRLFYYKFIVIFFYHLGDIACRINAEWAFDLYQKSMKLSVHYDEKINFWWWKEPINNHKDL